MGKPSAPGEGSAFEVRIRILAMLLLRIGLGLNLLNAGLLAYMRMRPGIGPGYSFLLPYLQIVVGLALLLGIYTAAAALCSGFLVLMPPLVQTATLLSGGYPPSFRSPFGAQFLFESGNASQLLLVAAVLWSLGGERSPWSLDGLIFGQREAERTVRPWPTTSPEPDRPAADGEGSGVIATCAESPDRGSKG